MVSRHGRLQAQPWFQRHEEFLKNTSPVQPYHTLCIEHFFLEGKAKAAAAAPATLALLLQSPSRPANIMKPFRCRSVTASTFFLCATNNGNRLVADGSGKYIATAALIFAYAKSVLAIQGNACEVFGNMLRKHFDNIDACVVLLSQKSRNLDELQHDLMRVQFCMRLSALITVTEPKMEKEVNKWFHELKPSAKAWSTIKFVRGIAIDCMLEGMEKVTRVRWMSTSDIVYICPKSGTETRISLQMIRRLTDSFDSRAAAILTDLNVPELSEEQLASIRDPLTSSRESGSVSLMCFNAELSEWFSEVIKQIARGDAKTLDKLTELHLCVMCKSAMEGAGILRFTEAVCAMYSSPNQLARRTLYWEDCLLAVLYDWTKVHVQANDMLSRCSLTVLPAD